MLRLVSLAVLVSACAARHHPTPSPLDAALPAVDDCAAFRDPKLERTLDRRTHSKAIAGNAAMLLVNGDASWARREENAAGADLILVKTFIYTDDEAGRAVSELLRERARAGATVVVQYDLKGSLDEGEAWSLYTRTGEMRFLDKPLLADMVKDGVIVVPTNVPRSPASARGLLRTREKAAAALAKGKPPEFGLGNALTHFDHEKYWITGKLNPEGALELRAILGGLNIASEYAYGGTDQVDAGTGRGGWRDTDVEVRGPVTTDIVHRFFEVLEANVTEWPAGLDRARWEVEQPAAGTATVRFVWNQPTWGTRGHIEHLYLALMRATPDDGIIRIASAYFTPSPMLRRPMERHLRKGGRLSVVTNSIHSTDVGLVVAGSRGAFERLLDVGPAAALHEWNPSPGLGTMHSKVASFGTCGPTVIGSANLDGLSAGHNSESVVMIEDPALRAAFDTMYDDDLTHADRITLADLERSTRLVRWANRGIYWLAWSLMME